MGNLPWNEIPLYKKKLLTKFYRWSMHRCFTVSFFIPSTTAATSNSSNQMFFILLTFNKLIFATVTAKYFLADLFSFSLKVNVLDVTVDQNIDC